MGERIENTQTARTAAAAAVAVPFELCESLAKTAKKVELLGETVHDDSTHVARITKSLQASL